MADPMACEVKSGLRTRLEQTLAAFADRLLLLASIAAAGCGGSAPTSPSVPPVIITATLIPRPFTPFADGSALVLILNQSRDDVSGRFTCVNWQQPDACPQFEGRAAGTLAPGTIGSRVSLSLVFPTGASCSLEGTHGTFNAYDGSFTCTFGSAGLWNGRTAEPETINSHPFGPAVHFIRMIAPFDDSNNRIRWIVALDQTGGPGRIDAVQISGGWFPGQSTVNLLVQCDAACVGAQLGSARVEPYHRYYVTLAVDRPFPAGFSGPFQFFSTVTVKYVDDTWGSRTGTASQPAEQWPPDGPR